MNVSYGEFNFLYPFFLAAPLLYLLKYLKKPAGRPAVPYSNISLLKAANFGLRARLREPVMTGLSFIFISLLAVAASRPQRVEQITVPAESRNILLTLDLSGSMSTPDFRTTFGRISRLAGVKTVVSEFIQNRQNDRIGLVVFGTNAFLQTPLTMDHKVLQDMVNRLEVGIAGEDTAIGDGLGLSLKHIDQLEGHSKAIILVTDGVNRAGAVNPLKAARVAKDLNIKIHTIGIGGEPQPGSTRFGLLMQNLQAAEYDEKTLKEIAEITGGVFFNASSIEGLKQVYKEIDDLEKTESEEPTRQIVTEYFQHFLLAAIAVYLTLLVLGRSYFLKIPE